MWYIRFLKVPECRPSSRPQRNGRTEVAITFTITITTDLGDEFLEGVDSSPDTYPLIARLVQAEIQDSSNILMKPQVLAESCFLWPCGKRSVIHQFAQTLGRDAANSPFRLIVSPRIEGDSVSSMASGQMPRVVSIWSDVFDSQSGKSTSGRVQRRFPVGQTRVLNIWEETGESIARHVWDAGVATCSYVLDATTSCRKSPNLFEPLKNEAQDLKVLELGSGCGIGGLAFALIAPNLPRALKCKVLLTDLPEAMPILDFNISQNKYAKSCTVESQILNWDDEASLKLLLKKSRFDIVLVSDCTYNCDSCPALVRTLSAIAKPSNPIIVVFMKVRHESEGVFFILMKDARFSQTSRDEITLPHDGKGYSPNVCRQKVDIYTFRLSKVREVPKASNDLKHKRTFEDVGGDNSAEKLQTDLGV